MSRDSQRVVPRWVVLVLAVAAAFALTATLGRYGALDRLSPIGGALVGVGLGALCYYVLHRLIP